MTIAMPVRGLCGQTLEFPQPHLDPFKRYKVSFLRAYVVGDSVVTWVYWLGIAHSLGSHIYALFSATLKTRQMTTSNQGRLFPAFSRRI